jgi:SAM-dependent methyltransferase
MADLRVPFPSNAFSALAQAESGHWWFRSRNRLILWVLRTRVTPFQSFLEIGCGTGFVLEGIAKTFPNTALFGSEYFEEGLVHARTRLPQAFLSQLDATQLAEREQYDVIGAFDVIEHIEEDERVLANVSRALKTGGWLLVTVPQHRWLWSVVDEHACHVRRYTREGLLAKVQAAGLSVDFVTSFVSLLVPLMWLTRWRARDESYDPMAEFRIPSWLNGLLQWVMRLELGLIKVGVRWPVGGSLLLLARKA